MKTFGSLQLFWNRVAIYYEENYEEYYWVYNLHIYRNRVVELLKLSQFIINSLMKEFEEF